MRLLLIGDSIRMGYEPHVRMALAAHQFEVFGPSENCETSAKVLDHIDRWTASTTPHMIYMNCGLHDLRTNPGARSRQVSLPQYEQNLRSIFGKLATGSNGRLIWATTTPVMEERHNLARHSTRYAADVMAYNQAGTAVAEEFGLIVHDLHGWVCSSAIESIGPDGVHFTELGYQGLGGEVARFVLEVLGSLPRGRS